ncbi:hypothetical protein QYF36_003132 [Acer negundo]|nr:hypothetical protein QYF36_003132 [Acer negundo]
MNIHLRRQRDTINPANTKMPMRPKGILVETIYEKTVRDFEGGGVRVVEGLLRGKRKPKMEDSIFQESCRCRRAICSSVEITPTTIVSPDIKLVCSEEKIFSYSNCNEIARWRRHDSCRSRSRDGGVSLVDEALRQ